MILRATLGLLGAALLGAVSVRRGSLTPSGGAAAGVTGALAAAAGWWYAALLIAFFVTGTALSRLGAATKAARTDGVVAKAGPRDARQVAANGGVFALAAVAATGLDAPILAAAALGALCGAFADTAATEIGTWIGGTPLDLRTMRPLAPGLSGGVTLAGTVASALASAALAGLALLGPWSLPLVVAGAVGGVVGSGLDSLLGATVQARRHCPTCDLATERARHRCGQPTQPAGGLAWMDNDAVNAAATLGAGAAAVLLASAWGAG
jgi:uncharacterized protein (TIGR00297 family)